MKKIIKYLNEMNWRSAQEITDEAERLIRQHIQKMRNVIEYLAASQGLDPAEAYARTQSAGSDDTDYGKFMEMLFNEVSFRGAGVRENLIQDIASYYFWEADDELKGLENPWHPLIKLFELGYTSSFDENENGQSITVTIGYRHGKESYKLI